MNEVKIVKTLKSGTRIFVDATGDYFIQDRQYPRDVLRVPKRMMREDLMTELVNLSTLRHLDHS